MTVPSGSWSSQIERSKLPPGATPGFSVPPGGAASTPPPGPESGCGGELPPSGVSPPPSPPAGVPLPLEEPLPFEEPPFDEPPLDVPPLDDPLPEELPPLSSARVELFAPPQARGRESEPAAAQTENKRIRSPLRADDVGMVLGLAREETWRELRSSQQQACHERAPTHAKAHSSITGEFALS